MFLARVIGQVVATKKEESLQGRRLVILRPLLVNEKNPAEFREGVNTVVAVDTMGAGTGETVMFVQGSSARQVTGLKSVPVDASVVGIVDAVTVFGESIYQSGNRE